MGPLVLLPGNCNPTDSLDGKEVCDQASPPSFSRPTGGFHTSEAESGSD